MLVGTKYKVHSLYDICGVVVSYPNPTTSVRERVLAFPERESVNYDIAYLVNKYSVYLSNVMVSLILILLAPTVYLEVLTLLLLVLPTCCSSLHNRPL